MFESILNSIIQAIIPSVINAGASLLFQDKPKQAPQIHLPSFAPPGLNPTQPNQGLDSASQGLAGAGSATKPTSGMNFQGGMTGGQPLQQGSQPGAPSTGFTTLGNGYYNPKPTNQARPGFQGI